MTATKPLAASAALAATVALWSPAARTDPLFGWGEDVLEDRFVDGDIDEEDHVAMRLADGTRTGRAGRVGASDQRGESWVSLVGFTKQLQSGRNDIGAFLVVGLAFDRIAAGSTHRLADPPRPAPTRAPGGGATAPPAQAPPTQPSPPAQPTQTPPPAMPPGSAKTPPVTPPMARACVAAALRASGLGTDDARIDALMDRARASAWFPEARTRAMRLWNDAAHTTTIASTDTANFYDAVGANLVLELRLTWRLDRLLYAGDEPTLERVRLERQDARSRLAARTLEVLFTWQRAIVGAAEAVPGSRDAIENQLRAAEAQATLDVLTAGWFSSRASGTGRDGESSGEVQRESSPEEHAKASP